jgi:chromosome segregation ATPase
MNDNIKDLIDEVEKENSSHAQMEQTIQFLKEEIKRLKFTIREQKAIIEDQAKNEVHQDSIPEDVKVLKELVQKQREEIERKEFQLEKVEDELFEYQKKFIYKNEEIEDLNECIVSLNSELEGLKVDLSNKVQKEKYQNAQKIIEELTETNLKYSTEIDALNSKVLELEENDPNKELSIQLNEANNRIKQLENRNENLNAQIDYLQNELDRLTSETKPRFHTETLFPDKIQSYKEKLEYLEEELESSRIKLKKMEEINKSLKQENHSLSKKLTEEAKGKKYITNKDSRKNLSYNPSDLYSQMYLIERMFNLMEHDMKEQLISSLIEDLTHSDPEIRIISIKILAHINTEPVLEALKALIGDSNWIVRYHVVNALSQFEKSEAVKEVLLRFLEDTDVDVRELAFSYLKNC